MEGTLPPHPEVDGKLPAVVNLIGKQEPQPVVRATSPIVIGSVKNYEIYSARCRGWRASLGRVSISRRSG